MKKEQRHILQQFIAYGYFGYSTPYRADPSSWKLERSDCEIYNIDGVRLGAQWIFQYEHKGMFHYCKMSAI